MTSGTHTNIVVDDVITSRIEECDKMLFCVFSRVRTVSRLLRLTGNAPVHRQYETLSASYPPLHVAVQYNARRLVKIQSEWQRQDAAGKLADNQRRVSSCCQET
jgi:hypothetical protein